MDNLTSIVGPTIEDLNDEEMMALTGGNGEAQPCVTPGTIVISITAVGISLGSWGAGVTLSYAVGCQQG